MWGAKAPEWALDPHIIYYLHTVFLRYTGHAVTAGEKPCPVIYVFLRITEILALTGCSAAGMNSNDILKGYAT